MTVVSMTGFARTEGARGPWRWVWEARSVNGRNLDVKLRTPAGLDGIEPHVREAVARRLRRGAVQLTYTLRRDAAAPAEPAINHALLQALIAAGAPYVTSGQVAPPRWDGLLALRGVLSGADAGEEAALDRAGMEALALEGLTPLLDGLAEARAGEGRALAAVMGALLDRIAALTAAAAGLAAAAPAAQMERLRGRLAALLADGPSLDPVRLAQEAAALAAKSDTAEELERLAAHVAEARTLLAGAEPAGRRLEFLTQELHREANTLGAKSGDLALTRCALDLKTAIDQLKEQAANVE